MTYDAVRRQGKLYDRQNHRYTWEYSPIECDITWEFDWVDFTRTNTKLYNSQSSNTCIW